MPDERCPACGGTKIVAGSMQGPESALSAFVPHSARNVFALNQGLSPSAPFRACLGCGLLWSAIEPASLTGHMRASGRELARQEADELEYGPCRELPDTEWGRMVGGYVAELDAMARAGGNGLLRRYRDMRGVTWDVANQEAGRWAKLTREEKLGLFGWVPKAKPSKDDLGELL